MLKRLLDKDVTGICSDEFSAACYSAVMHNHLEFCKKSLAFTRIILSAKGLALPDMRFGELLKKPGSEFNIPIVSAIRCAWMLSFINIKDMRIFNSGLFEKFETFDYHFEVCATDMEFKTINLDAQHLYILMQTLAINAPDRPQTQKFLLKLNSEMEPYADLYRHNLVDEESEKIYNEISSCALAQQLEVNSNKELIFGNVIHLRISKRPVFLFSTQHFQFQSEYYPHTNKKEYLLGIYKMRTKMLKSLGIEPIEILKSEWVSKSDDEKKEFLSSLLVL